MTEKFNNSGIVIHSNFNFSQQAFMQWMKRLNLYKMTNQRTEVDIQHQRATTRLYLTLLISKLV